MKVNAVNSFRYANYQMKNKPVKDTTAVSAPEVAAPSFRGSGKPLTKIMGGIGGFTAALAIIGTGGAAAVILPALAYTATCTGIGYAMDKDLEDSADKDK